MIALYPHALPRLKKVNQSKTTICRRKIKK